MKLLQTLKSKVQNWDCIYSDGKKSYCWKYNIVDVFDPIDD